MESVNVWADVRCPWCWIGLRRLDSAMQATGQQFAVRHRAYLLEPDNPVAPGRPLADVAVDEWGMTSAQWGAKSALVRAQGAKEGLNINLDTALTFDSRPIHRMLKHATAHRMDTAFAAWEIAFDAHLRRNVNLSTRAGLDELADDLGLGAASVPRLLEEDGFEDEVALDVDEAQRLGIRSVPTIVSGGRVLTGSRSVAELVAELGAGLRTHSGEDVVGRCRLIKSAAGGDR